MAKEEKTVGQKLSIENAWKVWQSSKANSGFKISSFLKTEMSIGRVMVKKDRGYCEMVPKVGKAFMMSFDSLKDVLDKWPERVIGDEKTITFNLNGLVFWSDEGTLLVEAA